MSGKISNLLVGSAGEYFVAGELSRHGLVAALTMSGTRAFDILAVNEKTKQQFTIQVKTTQYKKATWMLSEKDEALRGKNAFYVFVRLNEMALPDYYIVPADDVARFISERHQAWLNAPGKAHKPNSIREFQVTEHDEEFFNRWDYFL